MADRYDPFHIDLKFTVYDGNAETLPVQHKPVFVLQFDADKLVRVTRCGRHWVDNGSGPFKERISIQDAWVYEPTHKDVQHYPQVG